MKFLWQVEKMQMIKNRFIKVILLFVVFMLSLSCHREKLGEISNNVDTPFNVTQEEYAVFKTLLNDKQRNFVVLYGSPDEAFGIKRKFFEEKFADLQTDTLDSYIERNKMVLTINKQPLDFDYPIINKKDSEKKLEKASRYYEFSRVGFSKDGKKHLFIFQTFVMPYVEKVIIIY